MCEQIRTRINERSDDLTPTPNRPGASSEQTGESENANDVITSSDMVNQVLGIDSSRPIFVTKEALDGTDVRGKDISNLWVATLNGDGFVKVEEIWAKRMREECSAFLVMGLVIDKTTMFSAPELKQSALDYEAAIREDWIKFLGYVPTTEIRRSYDEMVDNCQITGADLEEILNKLPDETLERIFGTNDNSRTTARSDEETSALPSSGDEINPEPTPPANRQTAMDHMANQYDNWPKRDFDTKSNLNLADESFS